MHKPAYFWFFPFAWLGAAMLAACTPADPPRKPWREELAVIVVQDAHSADTEFESQLAALFAKHLHVKLRLIPQPPDKITPYLMTNRAHLAAAGLRSNDADGIRYGPSYQTVDEQVVCNGKLLRHIDDLVSRTIAVAAGSAQEEALREAQRKLPKLHWDARHEQTAASLLAEVAAGKLECTIANEEQLALAQNYSPNLDAAFDIAAPSQLAWAFAPDSDSELLTEAQTFFALIQQDGTLRRLLDRHYGHSDRLEPVDSVTFVTRTRTLLPRYRKLFEEAGMLTGIDWQLLASLSYQESHWNPLATSRTNVRGMMMLTEETADQMNVTDRLDARQSILAGARYLQQLKEQLPLRVPDEERTWLALAAYNQGPSHLEDARVLAVRKGLNPDTWADVKKVMPLLAQPRYSGQAKHGRARGGEAVILVETVHLYYDMLKHLNTQEARYLPETPFRLKFPDATKFSFP